MMRSIMKSTEFNELVIVMEYPEGIGTTQGIVETESVISYKNFKGTLKEVLLEGLIISHRDYHIEKELVMEVDHNFPFLKMQFELEGNSLFERRSKGCLDTDILSGQHQLFYFPEVKGRLTYPPCRRYTLEIILSVDYLRKCFGGDLRALKHFGVSVDRNDPVRFFPRSQPIPPAMKHVIRDFLYCEFNGVFRKAYLEAKVMELLVLQLSSCEVRPEQYSANTMKKEDVDKLYYVRELLTNNPENAYSLSNISEMSGLNDFKLKRGFKELFNNTVFNYLTEIRLEKARMLLTESEKPISDIAFSIGYKNPQHFTTAFKRRFGYLPKSVRR